MDKITFWKIKPGKRERWEKWCKEVIARKDEAAVTIREENLERERCIIIGSGDNSFVIYQHVNVPGMEKKLMNPSREINRQHRKIFDECLERAEEISGYDIFA